MEVFELVLLYLLLGIGPVIVFILAVMKPRHPWGYIALISLAICAAFPFTWLLGLFIS